MRLNLRPRTQPEVNLTSLIDVVFLLLIFFMVSTSFVKQSQINISLPHADSAAIVADVPGQIDIMITATGTYLINGRELINHRPAEAVQWRPYPAADDQRRRQCQTPACRYGNECRGSAWICANQYRNG